MQCILNEECTTTYIILGYIVVLIEIFIYLQNGVI